MTGLIRILMTACLTSLALPATTAADPVGGETRDGVLRIDLLPPGPGNPRNSEGDFIVLADGRILFIYTHFTGGAGDHAAAHLASRVSADGGETWSAADETVIANESGLNVMSVSLLRLRDGRIALFYAQKESESDCRPVMRTSSDEAKTWSEAVEIIPEREIGYYVLNNDRALQLDNGRIILPLARHHGPDWKKWTPYGQIVCYCSDDAGRSWQRGTVAPAAEHDGRAVMLQEPGVVELNDGRLMMLCRTDAGRQYAAWSSDQGETWTTPQPSDIFSPRSPATIERVPDSDDFLLVWNDHRDITAELRGLRTPLRLAVSRDNAATWQTVATLEDDPHGWYCYTAVEIVGDHVLLAYCAGDRRKNNGLAETRITRLPLARLQQTD